MSTLHMYTFPVLEMAQKNTLILNIKRIITIKSCPYKYSVRASVHENIP